MIKLGGILFDLDGVVFQGNRLIPGSKEILCALQRAEIPYRFITNTTRMTKNNLVKMLGDMGLAVDSNDIFAAPHAAAEYCELKGYNKILLFVPDQEMQEDFSAFQLVENNPDAVVVGDMGALFTFGLLNKIFRIIIDGAELVAMHKNRYWAPAGGLALDLGAFISALEYASNKSAAVMGKPNANLFKLAVRSWNVSKSSIYVVGDDLDGDILGAQNAGMKSILVKTGKFREEKLENSKIVPDYIINSIVDLSGLIQLS